MTKLLPIYQMKKNFLLLFLPVLQMMASAQEQPIRVEAVRFERHTLQTEARVALSGPSFHQMIGCGQWNILEARDDRGKDMRPDFKDSTRSNAAVHGVQAADKIYSTGAIVRMFLAKPSAEAKRLVLVRGTFSFYTGENPVIVTVPRVKSHLGQKLSAPALDEANIQIALDKPDTSKGWGNFLGFDVSGNVFALQSGKETGTQPLEFFDGINLSDSKSSDLLIGASTNLDGDLNGVSARRPIDDEMTLHLRVFTRFQRVEVPFELRDVPLPSEEQTKLNRALLSAASFDKSTVGGSPALRATIEKLLAQGADVNARDGVSTTPLLEAVAAEDAILTRLLLEQGANPNLINLYNGESPLYRSFFHHRRYGEANHQMAMLLLEHGADPNAGKSPFGSELSMAVSSQDLEVLRLLLSRGAKVDAQDYSGETALMKASVRRWELGVQALLGAGANPNLRGKVNIKAGMTALMCAVRDPKITELLLARGAEPNIVNEEGATALILVAQIRFLDPKYLEVARLLIARGADVNVRTKKDETALSLAKANNNAALIQLLQQAGAKS